jgi:hypothetical protein
MYQGLREASNDTAQIGGALHFALQLARSSMPNIVTAIALGETRRPGVRSTFNTLGLSQA